MPRLSSFFFTVMMLAPSVFAEDKGYTFYQVKKKEHLALILRELGYKNNVFGAGGKIEEIIQLNPWIKTTGADNIPIGVYLRVPKNLNGKLNTISTQLKKSTVPQSIKKVNPHIALFEAPADRNYLLALIETDGKNEFQKARIPMKLKEKRGTEYTVYVIDGADYESLTYQALDPIPHFKEQFLSEKKEVTVKTIDGKDVQKFKYEPWDFKDRFFIHTVGGIRLVNIKSEESSVGAFTISPGPGATGNLRIGVGFTSNLAAFLDLGGSYLTFSQSSGSSLTGNTQLLPHGGMGAWYKFDAETRLEATLTYFRDVFTTGSGTAIEITPVFRPRMKLLASYQFWGKKANQMFVLGGVVMTLPRTTESIELNMGVGFAGALKYRVRLNEKNNFDMIGSFESRSQSTSFSSDTFNTVTLSLGYAWN